MTAGVTTLCRESRHGYHSGMPKQKTPAGYYAGFTDLVLSSDTGEIKLGNLR